MGVKSNITTPLRKETYKSLQLNAGVTLVNFDLSQYSSAEDLKTAIATAIQTNTNVLGATRGGGTFTITRDIRQVEADGVRYLFVGSEIVDAMDGYLSETLIEITPMHIKQVLGNVDITTSGLKTTLSFRTAFEDGDYLTNVVWIGDTSEGFVAIELANALNTADFTFTFADKNEGTCNVEYHAHQGDVSDYENAPFGMIFFDAEGELDELTVTSAAGTNVGGTKITTDYTLGSGEHFVYKTGNTAPSIAYYEYPDYTWTEWDGSSDIAVGTGLNGKKITVALLNSSGRATKSGNATLVVKTT